MKISIQFDAIGAAKSLDIFTGENTGEGVEHVYGIGWDGLAQAPAQTQAPAQAPVQANPNPYASGVGPWVACPDAGCHGVVRKADNTRVAHVAHADCVTVSALGRTLASEEYQDWGCWSADCALVDAGFTLPEVQVAGRWAFGVRRNDTTIATVTECLDGLWMWEVKDAEGSPAYTSGNAMTWASGDDAPSQEYARACADIALRHPRPPLLPRTSRERTVYEAMERTRQAIHAGVLPPGVYAKNAEYVKPNSPDALIAQARERLRSQPQVAPDINTLLVDGAAAWAALVKTWVTNFEVPAAPQPDRMAALMTAMSGYGGSCGAYIRERGGLGGACIDTLLRCSLCEPSQAVALGKRMALNIVQVGTVAGVELDQFLEKSLFTRAPTIEEAATDNTPPKPGVASDTLNFERPGLPVNAPMPPALKAPMKETP